MTYWKDKIDTAMKKADGFVTKSNDMQISLGGVAAVAGFGSGALDSFSGSAYGAGSAIQTMATQIANGYQSLASAAGMAASAYDNLKQYANSAGDAMGNAANAARDASNAINGVAGLDSND